MVIENGHPREQGPEVVGDEVFERKESNNTVGRRGQLNESGQNSRHLDASEVLVARLRILHPNRQVQGESRDIRKRVRRVDGERGEDRENLRDEQFVNRLAVGGRQVIK